jgi:uncharacterized protein (DUF1330 family)
MAAYFFFDVREITDTEKAGEYRQRVFATVEQFGGRYLALGGPFEVIEGEWSPVIPVIIEFESMGRAREWYASEAYRPLKALRLEGTKSCCVLIEGFEHQY